MFSHRFRTWVLLAVFFGSMARTVNGQPSPTITTPSSPRQHPQYNINYYYARQLLPSSLSSSSSYDYWWPYPPAGVATSTTIWSPDTPTSTTFLSTMDLTNPVLAFTFESDSGISISSNSMSTTSLSSASSASESIISISALPPLNTSLPSNSHHKLAMIPPNTLVYIVPACGVVGVLIGGITAWCVYGCLTRNGHGRRRGRKSYGTLEVGPEYTPPSPRPGETQGEWIGGEKHVEEESEPGDASDDERPTETEGFLHPVSAAAQNSPMRAKSVASATTVATAVRAKSSRSSRAPSPTPSGRTSLFFDRPDSTDPLPWESLRHKSIKRGILERLRDDTTERVARRPWQAHGRHDSDLLVADAQADLSRTPSSASALLSRASTSATADTGAGFRIVNESPAETPQRERGAEVFSWPSVEDKYTRVPPRVARSRSRSPEKASRATSPEKFARGTSPDKLARAASPPVRRGGRGISKSNAQVRGRTADVPAAMRSVLPQSPPRISSPVLDGVLCFTSIPETTPDMPSFASFGAPEVDAGLMEPKEGKARRGGERRGRRGN
ncbi:hypothetical protein C8R43DRAFT_995107 [Mycena crocata]|nr:hypothetical protein C8R43DRAFT_995107 [Mycena crocata]